MIIRTENSIYEVDPNDRRIRRLSGKKEPSRRQGEDGQWRFYEILHLGSIGEPMFVDYLGDGCGTLTSHVMEIRE